MAEAAGLTVALPAFDQDKALAPAVAAWVQALDHLNRPYEILIVDDGSLDGTRAQADLLAARHARVRVLGHPERRGFGACLRTALEASTQPLFFYTSCDHGWNPSDLGRMLTALNYTDEHTGKVVEIVNGHRRGMALPKWRKRWNTLSRVLVRIIFGYTPDPPRGWVGAAESRFWWKCRLLFGLRIGDINSKFKLFRRSVFDRIEIQSDGEFVHAELLAKANFLGCMMDELVLADRHQPPPLPDVRQEMRRVFREPKFRSPVPLLRETPPAPEPPASANEPTPAAG
jgi:glycosyltransferase involved in cell wall biosynthesis